MTTHTTEQLAFLRSCEICVKSAAEDGRKQYVNRSKNGVGGFAVSGDCGKEWLFTAYPGGRKILSLWGKKLMEPSA